MFILPIIIIIIPRFALSRQGVGRDFGRLVKLSMTTLGGDFSSINLATIVLIKSNQIKLNQHDYDVLGS